MEETETRRAVEPLLGHMEARMAAWRSRAMFPTSHPGSSTALEPALAFLLPPGKGEKKAHALLLLPVSLAARS